MNNLETPPKLSTRAVRVLWRMRWWIAIPSIVVFIAAGIPLSIRYYHLSQVPEIGIPYSEADLHAQVPDEDNAYLLLQDAIKKYRKPTPRQESALDRTDYHWQPDMPALDSHLQDNQECLTVWLKAGGKPHYEEPRIDRAAGVGASLDVGLQREFVRLALMQAEKLTVAGRPDLARPWLIGVFRMSALVTHCNYHGRIFGKAFHSLAVSRLPGWLSHPHTTRDDLHQLLQAVMLSADLRRNLSKTLMVKDDFENAWYFDHVFEESRYSDVESESRWRLWLRGEPEFSRRLSDHILANQLSYVDNPRRTRPPIVHGDLFDAPTLIVPPQKRLSAHRIHELREHSFLANQSSDVRELRFEARQACLLAAVAAHLHYLDHKRFPKTLADLVPKYLPKVPDDPYSPIAASILYLHDGNKGVVYSRYENGIDDGGTVVSYEESHGSGPPDYGLRLTAPRAED